MDDKYVPSTTPPPSKAELEAAAKALEDARKAVSYFKTRSFFTFLDSSTL